MTTPTLIILYNRPKITRKLIYKLSKIKPKNVYVFCDGPKTALDEQKVEATRKVVNSISWNCKINKKFLSKNIGCQKGVSMAVDWFFSDVDRGIILEDDCVPTSSFFSFATELLDKYEDDKRISQISGYNSGFQFTKNDSYYFSTYSSVWGWATWKNRWDTYHWFLNNGKKILSEPISKKMLLSKNIPGSYITNVQRALSGKLDSWAFIWSISNIFKNRLTIIPSQNMVSNIGFGLESTHTKYSIGKVEAVHHKLKKLHHPQIILPNPEFDTLKRKSHIKIYMALNILKELLRKIFYN
jgi:hypothetical protein